jgi:hypothetical protein
MEAVRVLRLVLGISAGCWALPCWAAEGTTAAGPVGGPDIRAAFLPPPGLYGAVISLGSMTPQVRDGSGNPRAGLDAVDIKAITAGIALLYVPDVKLFGGSIGILGIGGVGLICGQIVSTSPSRCESGVGDSYVEMGWSRFYGFTRKSREQGAYPIREGLAIAAGLGVVFPSGHYNQRVQASNGVSIGKNIWDVAPSVAFTYTTPPLIAEGTEFSTKIYLNNYFKNSVTDYKSGTLVDFEFAVSEHIGQWQVGVAGYYLRQIADDLRSGAAVAADGRRLQSMSLGGVINYDMAAINASVKLKVRTSVFAYNSGTFTSYTVTFAKKLF